MYSISIYAEESKSEICTLNLFFFQGKQEQ